MTDVRADYALKDNNDIVKIIVEAKTLGKNLDQPNLVMSLVSYAFSFELNDIFLTDGLKWQHFDKFQPGNVNPSKTFDIAKDDPVNCAAYLVQHLDAAKFWPMEETIDELTLRIGQLESDVVTLQQIIAALQPSTPSVPIGGTASGSTLGSGGMLQGNLNFVDLGNLPVLAGKRPTHLRLSDNTVLMVKSWKEILRECCKFVLAANPSISLPFPDRAGRTVSLLSLDKPLAGISYVTEQYNGQIVYIYVNYDAGNCIANAIHILKQTPVSQSGVSTAVVVG